MQIQARNHATAMILLEDEMNEMISLQMKIKTSINEIAEKDIAFSSPLLNRQDVAESSKIKELKEALQKSKNIEADLTNNNRRMKTSN
jgi:hypothetical protein